MQSSVSFFFSRHHKNLKLKKFWSFFPKIFSKKFALFFQKSCEIMAGDNFFFEFKRYFPTSLFTFQKTFHFFIFWSIFSIAVEKAKNSLYILFLVVLKVCLGKSLLTTTKCVQFWLWFFVYLAVRGSSLGLAQRGLHLGCW